MRNFQQLADFIPQIVWTAQPDGHRDYYNKQWYDFTGFPEAYDDESWSLILHPDEIQFAIDTWSNSVRNGEDYQIEYRFVDRKSPGNYRWFLGRAFPIKDEQGQITKWFGTYTDIDEHKRLAEILEQRVQERTQELITLNLQLQRSNENLQQFASIASHDLQEPLRKIHSFGDLLLNQFGNALGENGVDIITRMQTSSSRMSTLIKDLLSYSRLTTHRESFEWISLDQVLADVIDNLEVAIKESEATIHVGPLPTMQGNEFQLRQLFQNLLSNALKFIQPRVGSKIQVSSCEVDKRAILPGLLDSVPTGYTVGTFWEISITDNGIGFDEKYLDRIFRVFERLHTRNQYAGTGVGLAICSKIVETHGGILTARSKPNEGATFLIYLPK